MLLAPRNGETISNEAVIEPGAVGYVFRTDNAIDGWSYIGQSTRLDVDHMDGYFGSGVYIQKALVQNGTEGLRKSVVGTAASELELHYLEMLQIAEARAAGSVLLNGDFGGPRPFPTFQLLLWDEAPQVMSAVGDAAKFHRALVKNQAKVEAAIERATASMPDEFYEGYERDLLMTMDLSHDCPTCGSPAGEVCRTNAKSLTLAHNPAKNHAKRPRSTER
ncbi:hypothetical protein H9639_05055 [Arthrobacter sp. Sa2CUA1]|uniref:DNA-binding phage zinc finger domain-containing protein n=1 Tax=Arthrobacter gallicola TaxID=2762225 RepID=A0ABR8UQ33_9MICC|nr:hypothetical protein [Arthrobacter gallicola]MBD7994661.1 hypothetical protein [Arthrobacter gallicola]